MWLGLGLLGLMGAALYFGFRQHPSSFDDAYITYRYARNIALGRGFVYNISEPVLGTTTPLYTLLLAALSLIWSDLPKLSHAISVLAWTLAIPITYGIGRAGKREALGLIAAALIAFGEPFLNVLGMETTLYVLLALLTFYFYVQEKTIWAAIFAGLTFLIRWDGILVVGAFLFAELLRRRKDFWRAALVSAALVSPWLIYSYLTFGSIFPNTFFAKVGQGRNPSLGGSGVGTFAHGLRLMAEAAYAENPLFIFLPVFATLGLFFAIRHRVQWWPLLLWTATYIGGYVVLGVLRFHWYYPPILPAVALLTAAGIVLVKDLASDRLGSSTRQTALTTVLALLCLVPNVDWLMANHNTEMGVRPTTYFRVGQWLENNTPPDSSVALMEIGIVGYYSDRTVVDTMGLVSPEATEHLEGWFQTVQFAVNHYWPDYVVTLRQSAWEGVVHTPWFNEAYALETQIENPRDSVSPVKIYRRRPGFPVREFDLEFSPSASFDQAFSLRGFQIAEDQVQPGGSLHVQLRWEAQTDISGDYRWQFNLLDASTGEQTTLATGLQPLRGGNPTYQWREGNVIVDAHTLTVPEEMPVGYYLLQLNVSGVEGPVAPTASDAPPLSQVTHGPIKIGTEPIAAPQPTYPTPATFANNINLLGYDLRAPSSSESAIVTLYWQATGKVSRDYTIFVHLLSPEGELIGQHDSQPFLPTSLWAPGAYVTDAHTLALPVELAAGAHQLRVGLYQWPELERAPILMSGCMDAANDSLLIGQIAIDNVQPLTQSTCPESHWIELEIE